MNRFIAEDDDFVSVDIVLPLVTTKRLLEFLDVVESGRESQEAAVTQWLKKNQPSLALLRSLQNEGFVATSGTPKSAARSRPRKRRKPLVSGQVQRHAIFDIDNARIANNPDLREPQREGHAVAAEYFRSGGSHGVLEIPVGCGKTGLISILPFGIAKGRVLVIAPNLTIKDQIAASLDISNPDSFYRQAGVLAEFSRGPFRAVLDSEANISDCDDADIVVANIHQLAQNVDRWLPNFTTEFFDLIIVDEAHHNAAPSWRAVFERFPRAKVASLTATPFRADGVPVEGDRIYRYTFRQAMLKGYIKQLSATNVAPSEIFFTYKGEERHHTLEEVLLLREDDWFSRGIALAPESNASIVDASIQWLQHLRLTGTPHQIVASACSLDHARQVRGLYEERGLNAKEIHSKQSSEHKEQVFRDLKAGRLDVIVQVQMLGEGFDHPPLSVAAIFRPYRALSPYIQFVGRAMRVNVQNTPGHPDNVGVIVSHVGLNIDRHWQDFKMLDSGDQALVEEWLTAEETSPSATLSTRRRLKGEMQVTLEVLDRFISDAYIDPADEALIENAINSLREQGLDLAALGLDHEELQRRLVEAKKSTGPEAPIRLPVQPQARRQVLRNRLNEQAKSAANRILHALDQPLTGQNIAIRSRTGAANNLGAVIALMHRAVNDFLGIGSEKRRELSLEELEQAAANLDEIADSLQDSIRDWV